MAMPTTCRPSRPKSRCARTNSGISSRQGPHQVAQKLTTSTLPCHCRKGCCEPWVSGSDNARRSCASRGCRSHNARPAPAARASPPAKPNIKVRRRRLSFLKRILTVAPGSLEPRFLWSFVRWRRDDAAFWNWHRHPLNGRGVTDADIGATLRLGGDDDLLSGLGVLEREIDDDRTAIRLDVPEERVVLDGAFGQVRHGQPGRGRLRREVNLVAVQVVAVGDAESRFHGSGVDHARTEPKRAIG